MRKAFSRMAFGLAAALVVLVCAIPFAVPPVVEHVIATKIAEFGLFPDVRMSLGYRWLNGPCLAGELSVAVMDSPWRATARFSASCFSCAADVLLGETPFSETDPTVRALLSRCPLPAVSNLTFSGSVALRATAERTFGMPVPVWAVSVPFRNVSADMVWDGKALSLEDLSFTAAATGIADHVDVTPTYIRAKALSFAGLDLSKLSASVLVSEKNLLVTSASAGLCGGTVNLHSLFLDTQSLNAGFTLYLDNIDAGEALTTFKGFEGTATGRLHGKLKLSVREGGKAVRMSDAFLYSTPGEGGKIRMENPEAVTDGLALVGIDDATRNNVNNALTDLDYSVLKMNLKRLSGRNATLTVHVDGSATRNGTTVPVDLTVNVSGELEQLINTGLGYAAKMKGKQK